MAQIYLQEFVKDNGIALIPSCESQQVIKRGFDDTELDVRGAFQAQ